MSRQLKDMGANPFESAIFAHFAFYCCFIAENQPY